MTARSPNGEVVRLEVSPEIGAAGTSYWVEGAGEHARAVMIPEDERAGRTVRPLLLRQHATKSDFAAARFVNVAYDGGTIPLTNTPCSSWCRLFASPFGANALPLIDAALVEMHQRVDALSQ